MRTQKEIEQYLKIEIGEPLSNKELEWYIDNAQNPIAIPKESVYRYLNNIEFVSPNEPLMPYGVDRITSQVEYAIKMLEKVSGNGRTISIWDQNLVYDKEDIVLYFKKENKQVHPDVGKREFVFILMSLKDGNESTPNYDIINGIPDFTKSNWRLLNPASYLLQDIITLRTIITDVFKMVMENHIQSEHGIIGDTAIEDNLVRKDYTNLKTNDRFGEFSLTTSNQQGLKKMSNGVMEYSIAYSFDRTANKLSTDLKILDSKYFFQDSPVWDESDQTIFAQKYSEDNLFSVVVNTGHDSSGNVVGGTSFGNLRYGTNIFHTHINFETPFADDQYCVFFDTYGNGEFVFGLTKDDLMSKTEPTYDAVVSMPMLMNKRPTGFDIVLPIHTYFNSISKYKIGVPWKNQFRLQAIGRYR